MMPTRTEDSCINNNNHQCRGLNESYKNNFKNASVGAVTIVGAASPHWSLTINSSNNNNNNNRYGSCTHKPPISKFVSNNERYQDGSNKSNIISNNNAGTGEKHEPNEEQQQQYEENDDDQQMFSPLIAFCFTMNYVVGTGFLTIPWAFVQSGMLLSFFITLLCGFISDIAKDYILETMTRTEHMLSNNPTSSVSDGTTTTTTTNLTWMTYSNVADNNTNNTMTTRNLIHDHHDMDGNNNKFKNPLHDEEEKIPILHDHQQQEHKQHKQRHTNTYCHDDSEIGMFRTKMVHPMDGYDSIPNDTIKYQINGGVPRSGISSSSSLSPGTSPNRINVLKKLQFQVNQKHQHQHQHDHQRRKDGNNHQPVPSVNMANKMEGSVILGSRKFEMNLLCRLYLGKKGVHLYTLLLSLYVYGTLCAYTNVFASAMASTFPLTDLFISQQPIQEGVMQHFVLDNYILYTILFSFIVVPMSCLELHEQIHIQVGMTILRFMMLSLMILTSYHCSSSDQSPLTPSNTPNSSGVSFWDPYYFQPSGIFHTLPILIMANMYHPSIPGLSHQVKDKYKLGSTVFRSTSICTVVCYATLGIVVGTLFGPAKIQQSANLNWNQCGSSNNIDAVMVTMTDPPKFRQLIHSITSSDEMRTDDTFLFGSNHRHDDWTGMLSHSFYKFVSFFIILFPVIDVISVFPLNAITLGNNMFGAYYGKNIHQVENNRFLRTFFRLLASLPPILLSTGFRELGLITACTGTTGFLIGISIPAILYLKSKERAIQQQFPYETYYSTRYGSHNIVAMFLFWFGIIMFVFVTWSLVIS